MYSIRELPFSLRNIGNCTDQKLTDYSTANLDEEEEYLILSREVDAYRQVRSNQPDPLQETVTFVVRCEKSTGAGLRHAHFAARVLQAHMTEQEVNTVAQKATECFVQSRSCHKAWLGKLLSHLITE